ncbi:MAG: UbiA family prenyltransferase [Acidiferrobacterales bacterium]
MNLRAALYLGRVSNLPTVWTNVLAGIVLSGGDLMQIPLPLLSLSLFYIGGMYLNDAFDCEIDRRERPERPIPAGLVSLPTVFVAGFGMLAGGIAVLLWGGYGYEHGTGWRAPAAGGLLATVIIYYNWHHKQNPLSPLIMGACRMLVYVTAALTVTTALSDKIFVAAVALLCYLIGLTYIAKQEHLGTVKRFWPLAFWLVPLGYLLPTVLVSVSGAVLYAVFVGWVGFALSYLLRPSHISVPTAVAFLLAGISLLDALLIAGEGVAALAWVAVGGFGLTLIMQRAIPAT